MSDQRRLGGVGTKVLFDNDRVRVWELRLDPGEESDVHRHDFDHVLVQIAGDRVAVVPEADTEGPYRDYLEAEVVPGMAVQVSRGGVETARNIGAEPYHEVIVELKDGPGGRPRNADGPGGRPRNADGPGGRPRNADGPGGRPRNADGPGGRPRGGG